MFTQKFKLTIFKVLVDQLLRDVVTRYMKMATCQFLRDFRRSYNLKKTAEHRKRVLQRKQVAAERNDHPKFATIVEDRSAGKHVSHHHLHSFVQKHGITGVKRVYTKEQLVKLCRAYGITVRTSQNKQQLAHSLTEQLLKAHSNSVNVPHPYCLDRLQAQGEVNSGRIVLRISRSN